jgi:LPXTG-motif cell wall-anchored protein
MEDQLAEYTDSILNDQDFKQDEATFAPDPELRALEETALRLKHSFGNDDPDEVAIQRMHNNIVREWRQEKAKASQPFWQKWIQMLKPSEQKWQSRQSRQRFSMALSLTVLVVLMLVSIPFLNTTGSNQPAAGGQNFSAVVLIALGGLILLGLWLFRRKP